MQIVLGIVLAPDQNPSSPVFGLITALNAVSHLVLIAGVVGLILAGVAVLKAGRCGRMPLKRHGRLGQRSGERCPSILPNPQDRGRRYERCPTTRGIRRCCS